MTHLTEEQISRYLDRAVARAELPLLEAHLADCSACRRELVGASRVLRTPARVRPWQIAGAAAAGIALILLLPRLTSPEPDGPVLRGGGTAEGVARIEPVAPSSGTPSGTPAVVFAWHPIAGGESYRVTILTEAGDSVWAGRTSDTTITVPMGEGLRSGVRYFWYVDGLLRDGRSATTGSIPFSTPP